MMIPTNQMEDHNLSEQILSEHGKSHILNACLYSLFVGDKDMNIDILWDAMTYARPTSTAH